MLAQQEKQRGQYGIIGLNAEVFVMAHRISQAPSTVEAAWPHPKVQARMRGDCPF